MPVEIQVKFYGMNAKIAGCRESKLEVPGNFFSALEVIQEKFHLKMEEGLNTRFSILVNGRAYSLKLAENNELQTGDVVAFVPVVAGG